MALQLSRDIKPLGNMSDQLASVGMEGICYDQAILPMLNDDSLTSQQCDRLIAALLTHRHATRDPVVEAARYEHLMLKRLFHELETNSYSPSEYSTELFGESLPRGVMVHKELTTFCFYGTNDSEVESTVEDMAKDNQNILIAQGDVKSATEGLGTASTVNSTLAPMFLTAEVVAMTDADYQEELEVLIARHQQLVTACDLPFPESTKAIEELQVNWTSDELWKATKVLKWFTPHEKLATVRARSGLRNNAMLGLTAIRKFELENSGNVPTDLKSALAAASIDELLVDPHSGDSLKFVAGTESLLYSVGPDGIDDRARTRIEYWESSPEKKGDIVFELD